MTSRTTNRRQIKQVQAAQVREQQANDSIKAADHYTAADRATSEALEATEMLAEFVAREAPLRERLCTPMSVASAARLLA